MGAAFYNLSRIIHIYIMDKGGKIKGCAKIVDAAFVGIYGNNIMISFL